MDSVAGPQTRVGDARRHPGCVREPSDSHWPRRSRSCGCSRRAARTCWPRRVASSLVATSRSRAASTLASCTPRRCSPRLALTRCSWPASRIRRGTTRCGTTTRRTTSAVRRAADGCPVTGLRSPHGSRLPPPQAHRAEHRRECLQERRVSLASRRPRHPQQPRPWVPAHCEGAFVPLQVLRVGSAEGR